jgi:two-component system repressor protein LuxO
MTSVLVEFPQVRYRAAEGRTIHGEDINMTAADMAKRSILLVEDTMSLTVAYQSYLRGVGAKVSAADTGAKCLASIASAVPDVLVLDLGLPDMNGLDILRSVRKEHPAVSVVVITNNASLGTAVEAMRLGAFDYVVKPFNAERLNTTVRNALERTVLRQEVREIRKDISRETFHGFVGGSKPMQAVYRMIESAAPSKATVFITGESGTGKEVCAAAIHAESDRSQKPFVPLNCAAIPRELMESEIFGHVKGAFSGAVSDRTGAAMSAHGGTLFLDEICEMDMDLQAKLLRLLQSGTVQRVGANKAEPVDIRVVCATNRNPMEEVQAGRFREDLYYRLHVIPMHLPPLRERGADVAMISNFLLGKFAAEEGKEFDHFSPEAEARILAHAWPGNVRELQNAIRNAVVLNSGAVLEADMLPGWLGTVGKVVVEAPATPQSMIPVGMPMMHTSIAGIRPLWQVERDAIQEALRICDGNVTRAAAFLEIGASTLYRKKAEFEALQAKSA